MSYRIEHDESVGEAVRRIAGEQLDAAARELAAAAADPERAVHETRKRCKKLRALLRLVRHSLGDAYGRENAAVRDAARRISSLRDVTARIESLGILGAGVPDDLDRGLLEPIRARMRERRDRAYADRSEVAARLEVCAGELRAVRERVPSWELDADGFDALAGGLSKTYRRGRRARPSPDDSTDAFHGWRKRVKVHGYHLRLLRAVWPDVLGPWRDAADDLGDRLGDAHDLAVLDAAVREDPQLGGETLARAVHGVVDARRKGLRDEALALGRRLYAEKPGALVRRLGEWWAVWRDRHALCDSG